MFDPMGELDELTRAMDTLGDPHDPRLVVAAAMRVAANAIERIDDGKSLNWVLDALMLLTELTGCEINADRMKFEVKPDA